ncbi:g2506 [Coccomyxa elongata]|nr:probable small EDRK-rich factor 2 [Coccomyxa sp. Obi]
MTRGNQREIDRQRALKRSAGSGVPAKDKDGLTAAQRKERDALALQAKQAAKAAAKASGGGDQNTNGKKK